jgi:PKD repeat protein
MKVRQTALLALGLFATPLFAQYWTRPASAPNVDVKCTGCSDKANGQWTPGYPATLLAFTGRYLDSDTTNDCQQPVRTFRAVSVLPRPALNAPHGRLYFQIGSSVMAYDMDRFFQRIAAGEPLINNVPSICQQPVIDTVLNWDSWYYAEDTDSGWDHSNNGDGQTRLYGLDVDDQGYVYLATKWFRWGIVKDGMTHDTAAMKFVSQPGPFSDDVIPVMVVSLKASNGTYYAAIGDSVSSRLNLFDVTDRAHPQKRANLAKSIYRYAKNNDGSAIGIATTGGRFEIYTTDTFVANGAPLVNDAGPGDAPVRGVASDGVNFYIATDGSNGLVISSYAPNGSGGYVKVADFPTPRATLATESLKFGDGYLVHAGITDGGYELRLFKATVGGVSEVDLSIPALPGYKAYYFKNYYVINSSGRGGYVGAGLFGQFHDSAVVTSGGRTYLIVTAFGLGDVYELQPSDAIAIRNHGSVGTPNPNRPAGGSAGPFYGDPIGFTGSAPDAAPTNIQWNFGNAEGTDPNVVNGMTGQQITHRYSGITSAALLPLTRTVTATSLSNANLKGAIAVTVARPSVAVGIAGVVATQASQLASIPIVAGDRFVDASDGSVESHVDTWSIDGSAASALPSESVSAGACAAAHTLNFDARYGDLPIGIHGAAYSVRPFAASVVTTPSSSGITFTAAVRKTGDTTILSAAQAAALQYRWQLIDAAGNVLIAGPSGSGAVPPFTAPKSSFTSRGIRGRLTLTSPTAVGGACAGRNMESADAFTPPLNGPDPVVNGDCTAGGPPCAFSVASVSGVDPAADHWSYSWSVQPANFHGATHGATFAPLFTAIGQYTVSVTVANGIGSSTASKSITVTKTPPPCPQMLPGNNVFISYQSAGGSCSYLGGTCSAGEAVTFAASAFNYDFGCDTHTFTWDFGDGAQGTGQSSTHSFSAAGSYTVTLTIRNGAETVATQAAVTVASHAGCPSLDANSFYVAYSGLKSQCSNSGDTVCSNLDQVAFSATANPGFQPSCFALAYQWDFGDGSDKVSGRNVAHKFAAAGNYVVKLSVTDGITTVTYAATVSVRDENPLSVCVFDFTVEPRQPNEFLFRAFGAGGATAASYEWDFGDGAAATSTTPLQTHAYADATPHVVTLTVPGTNCRVQHAAVPPRRRAAGR